MAMRFRCQGREVHVGSKRHGPCMHGQDFTTAFAIGRIDTDFPVEASGPAQCRIDAVGQVGCRQDHDLATSGQAVHQGQQLRDDAALDLLFA